MKIYLTDEVVLVAVIKNEWGVETDTDLAPEPARVEDKNQIVLNSKGEEVTSNMTVFLNKNSTADYGYKIKIKKKNGIAFDQPDKKFMIKSIAKKGMFKRKFIVLYL